MIKSNTYNITIAELQQLVATTSDTIAFEKLYLLLYKDLHQFAYRIIKSDHIAEEIVSDVFVQLWKKRADLTVINNLRVFIYVAVKNQALTYLYKARKQKVCWIEEFTTEAETGNENNNPDELLIAKDTAANLQEAVRLLPDKCKAVFTLVKEDGLKYTEAARVLNLSVKTVENQMGIALKKIAAAMKYYIGARKNARHHQL